MLAQNFFPDKVVPPRAEDLLLRADAAIQLAREVIEQYEMVLIKWREHHAPSFAEWKA